MCTILLHFEFPVDLLSSLTVSKNLKNEKRMSVSMSLAPSKDLLGVILGLSNGKHCASFVNAKAQKLFNAKASYCVCDQLQTG